MRNRLLLLSRIIIVTLTLGIALALPNGLIAETEEPLPVEEQVVPIEEKGKGEEKAGTLEQIGKIVLYLGILAAMAVAAMQFVKQGGRRFLPGSRKKGSGLKVCDTHMLGNKQFLVVVEYEGMKILLGVGPGMINKLCYLNNNKNNEDIEASERIEEPEIEYTL